MLWEDILLSRLASALADTLTPQPPPSADMAIDASCERDCCESTLRYFMEEVPPRPLRMHATRSVRCSSQYAIGLNGDAMHETSPAEKRKPLAWAQEGSYGNSRDPT